MHMHEVATMQAVVSDITTRAEAVGGGRITKVRLLLGASGHMTAEGARQHFTMLAAGTAAENAEIEIAWVPATFQCFTCLQRFPVMAVAPSVPCPRCGEAAIEIAHEDTCAAEEIELEPSLTS
jgi:hydrogenase nickel incorporation protein HypA/HybF